MHKEQMKDAVTGMSRGEMMKKNQTGKEDRRKKRNIMKKTV